LEPEKLEVAWNKDSGNKVLQKLDRRSRVAPENGRSMQKPVAFF